MFRPNFFQQDTATVARALIGCQLVVFRDGEEHRQLITATEAYLGPEDGASHARFGRTKRSEIMFGPPGQLYVYLIYGLHHLLNIVTDKEGTAGAVLIRGTEDADGPGKLTKSLHITKEDHNGSQLGKASGVWIEGRPDNFNKGKINALPRIGIDYADKAWRQRKLRFVLSEE